MHAMTSAQPCHQQIHIVLALHLAKLLPTTQLPTPPSWRMGSFYPRLCAPRCRISAHTVAAVAAGACHAQLPLVLPQCKHVDQKLRGTNQSLLLRYAWTRVMYPVPSKFTKPNP
jgi:hypothetical protein